MDKRISADGNNTLTTTGRRKLPLMAICTWFFTDNMDNDTAYGNQHHILIPKPTVVSLGEI